LDAEYYRPEYLAYERSLSKHPILREFVVKILHPVEIKRAYEEKGIQILLAQNIRKNFLEFDVTVFMPEAVRATLKRNELQENDIVMTRSGVNYGDTSPYFGEPSPLYSCADDLVIRPKPDLRSGYLATFFNTDAGRGLIRRGGYGAAQPHIAPTFLKSLHIPRFSREIEEQVDSVVRSARNEFKQADTLYVQAEQMVLYEVGFNKVDLSWSAGYTVTSKVASITGRIDAEHFQPKYARLIRHLEKTGKAVKLGDIAPKPHRGAQPSYTEGGNVVVVNSQHLGRHLVNVEGCERTDERDYNDNPRAHLCKSDVLIYATGAYVGRTNVWLESMRAMASNHVTIVRPKKECDPRYLAVYLNSPLGMLQADSWATGSAQRELYPEEISKFIVYLPLPSFQQKVADLVTAAYEARAKAKKLLEEAKRKVEELIETP